MTIDVAIERSWVANPPGHGPILGGQCHASTLLVFQDRLHCAWFAGTTEGTADNHIWGSERGSQGAWSTPRILAGDGKDARWNPVLACSPAGEIWLFHKRGTRISEWSTSVTKSRDGTSWDKPVELVPGDRGGRGPVKNPPLLTEQGTWLAPASIERWDDAGEHWDSFIDRSTDGGLSWTSVPIHGSAPSTGGSGLIQPSLFRLGSSVGALMRSNSGSAYFSVSHDDGNTFGPAIPTNLPNNNSALTVVELPDGTLACVHNPVTGNWAERCPLAISLSVDGRHWGDPVLIIEDGKTPLAGIEPTLPSETSTQIQGRDHGVLTDGNGEYSYPAAILHEDRLIVSYTWQRQAIAMASVPLTLLLSPLSRGASPERPNHVGTDH